MMDQTPRSSAETRIHSLPCWSGAIEIEPLTGGLSNEIFLVADAAGKHVVRFGRDYPFHHVLRERELMTARAAADLGFAPKVEYAEPGAMVTAYIGARTLGGDDVRNDRMRTSQGLHGVS
jgi:thiamine kinase-like enzyme